MKKSVKSTKEKKDVMNEKAPSAEKVKAELRRRVVEALGGWEKAYIDLEASYDEVLEERDVLLDKVEKLEDLYVWCIQEKNRYKELYEETFMSGGCLAGLIEPTIEGGDCELDQEEYEEQLKEMQLKYEAEAKN